MKKILLNFIIFSQFILANDFNEEEFLQKMNKSLSDFIDSIPMTIEVMEYLSESIKNDQQKKQNEIIFLENKINEEKKEFIKSLNEQKSSEQKIKEYEEKIQQLIKERQNNYKKKNQKSLNDIKNNEINNLEKYINLTKKRIELIKKIKENCLSNIKSLQDDLNNIKNHKISCFSNLNIDKNTIFILHIFDKDISENNLIEIADKAGSLALINKNYFINLEQDLLEIQSIELEKIINLIKNYPLEYNETITQDHCSNFMNFFINFYDLHKAEKIRRKLKKANVLKLAHSFIDEAQKIIDIFNTLNSFTEKTNLQNEEVIKWQVITKKQPIKNITEEFSDNFNNLQKILSQKGPHISKEDALEYKFSNFSPLNNNNYHCHLKNNSNMVVIWKANIKTKTITIFYLGKHPNNYNSKIK